MTDLSISEYEQVTLCEVLDRILNKGAVVVGEVVISVADIDLIYLGLQLILTSVETARGTKEKRRMTGEESSDGTFGEDRCGV
jgi:hypothetical protein